MVNSVSNLAQLNYINTLLIGQRDQLNTLQDQISSGETATLYSGLSGSDGVTSISLHTEIAQIDNYSNNIALVRGRTSVMDTALQDVGSAAQSLSNDLLAQPQQTSDPGMANFNVQAQAVLSQLQSSFNSQYSGLYLFSASDVSNPPIANLSTLNTNVSAQLANVYNGTQTGAQALTNVQALSGTQVGLSSTLATAVPVTAQIDDQQVVDYTIRADNPSVQTLMQGLSVIANLKYDPNHPSDFWAMYNGAKQMIDQGVTGLNNLDAQNGLVQQQLNQADTAHQTTQTTLTTQLGDIENVDVAKATSQLDLLQTQLQASYKVISIVNQLSLASYL